MKKILTELKYISAYLIPLCCLIGFYKVGAYSWLTVIFCFVITPFLDVILPQSKNVSEINNKEYSKTYDWFLYLNIIWVFGLIGYATFQFNILNLSTHETIGLVLSLGLVLGTCGINVAHELGHRNKTYEKVLAQFLLLPTFYMHFFIEHNRGHHYNVATPLDPATAKKGEWLYSFWLKSIVLGYLDAWKIQLKLIGGSFLKADNKMLFYHIFYIIYLAIILSVSSWETLFLIIISGVVGVLLLETINYIEHYGLQRKLLSNGRYERVQLYHSWNANYTFGRIILFELTRHSDHHYKASKKYHTLEHQKTAPELPFGYPSAIICSLFPWLWFKVMDQRIELNN